MKKYVIAGAIVLAILIVVIFFSCSSNESNKGAEQNNDRTNSPVKTLPPLESSTSNAPVNSGIGDIPFLNADQISQIWTEEKICTLIGSKNAKKILEMDTTPQGKYKFTKETGARCAFPSASGDEIFIEISVSTFASARSVDRALGQTGENVTVSSVPGILKTSKANGATYELNVGGEQSNQWIVNGPDKSSSKQLAETLIAAIR